ncbi:MAG: hypothetical protein DCC71_21360 [Proteobacteria bacterium]|nr:MAG: hypothetical protein DCC71_21360 [Pseudomonadota bacterium]
MAALVATAFLPLFTEDAGALAIPFALFHLAVAGFIAWTLFGTAYRIGDDAILVRSGPFRWRIPLGAIVSVTPTRNPLSSPAVSLDRLRVAYRAARGERALMLSPADKAGFLAELAARCPSLRLAGDRLLPSRAAPS